MKANDIAKLEGYTVVVMPKPDCEIKEAYTGDLLSDVMANAPSDSALVTIQAHKNTVAVASLAGIGAIVICNGREAPDDMKQAALQESVNIFQTKDNQFQASLKIARLLGKAKLI